MMKGPNNSAALAEQRRQAQLQARAEAERKAKAKKDRLDARSDAAGRTRTSSLVRLSTPDASAAGRSFFSPTGGAAG